MVDGLGGLPMQSGGETELEAANTPNLDALAASSDLGLSRPVAAGVSPGSGPGHLGLFGYDPLRFQVGRGVLSALGVGVAFAAATWVPARQARPDAGEPVPAAAQAEESRFR